MLIKIDLDFVVINVHIVKWVMRVDRIWRV